MSFGKVGSALAASLALGAMACIPATNDDRDLSGDGPGKDPWNDDDVTCASNDDCAQGEACENGVCQVARCIETYDSAAPMGENPYFGTDGEMVVLSDASFVDAFEAQGGSYLNSWDLGADTVVDVAGGNFDGSKPMAVAVALQYSDTVRVNLASGAKDLAVGLWPVAIAAGDVDADGLDELVAFSADGEIALCDVDTGTCQAATIAGAEGKDVAIADVDADGFAEPLFLFDMEGESEIVVWNLDAEQNNQEESYGWSFNFPIRAIGAGDVDGDGRGEVVALEDGGWWGWANDKLHIFSPATEQIVGTTGINGHTRDVAVGDRNSDDKAEVAVLREDHKLELFQASAEGSFSSLQTTAITVGQEATRVSMVDWDGDSASGRLVSGPDLVSGNVVPTTVLTFPPYPHGMANGSSAVRIGNSEETSETRSDTVSLSIGLMVGYGIETPIFEAEVSAELERSWSVTKSFTRSISIGEYFDIDADPTAHGSNYGAVVLSCGCFHRYRYETDDPAGRVGGSGQIVEIFVPVGGQTVLWSTKRYNAMAKAVGNLPTIEVPYRVGDPASYPSAALDLNGQPIAGEDLVFPDVPSYQPSDLAYTTFWLSAGETNINEVAESIDLGVSGSFGVGGLSVELSAGVGYTQGYSIAVGNEALFAGSLPPIPDNPDTPEDEYELHRLAVTPLVFRQHYLDASGKDSGFYVMGYAVGGQ